METIADAIALLELVRRIYGGYKNRKIIGALFDWQGKRLQGDEKLNVKVHGTAQTGSSYWWYSVEPIDDYQFIRIPVNVGGVMEAVDKAEEQDQPSFAQQTPDARYFRYVHANPLKEWVNVRVNFMVFAYKPSDLLSTSKE